MLFPVDICGVGIVSAFGMNDHEAVSKVFDGTESSESEPGDAWAKARINDYLSAHQKALPAVRYMDMVSKKAIIAARGSLAAAGISDDEVYKCTERFGVVLTTSRGPCTTRRKLFDTFAARQQQSVSATLFSNCGYNIAGSLVAGFLGMRGANFTIASGTQGVLPGIVRSSVLLEKGSLDYVLVGYADGDSGRPSNPYQVSMADMACIFLISKADSIHSHPRSLRLEAVDENMIRKAYDPAMTFETGRVYGLPKGAGRLPPPYALDELKLSIHPAVQVLSDYLTFLQLAYLWESEANAAEWEFWLLPLKSHQGVTYLKVSPH